MQTLPVLLLLVAALAVSVSAQACPYSRDQAAACMLRYLDRNQDGALSSTEINYALTHYLNAMQRALAPTEAQFLANCDVNHDRLITMDEFQRTASTCMATCQRITQAIVFICGPAQAEYRNRTGHNRRTVGNGDIVITDLNVPPRITMKPLP